jgi:putative flippase GtrA
MNKIDAWFDKIKAKNQTLGEALMFYFLSIFTSLVDYGTFALCNYLLFAGLAQREFHWWVLDYGPSNGGLCAFLSMLVSYVVAQIFAYWIQRSRNFKATNDLGRSAARYAVMIVFIFFFTLWLPTVIGGPLYQALGPEWGATVVKLLSQFTSAVLQFPINKFWVMK